jgi:molybdenum cofactor cytidylyltransferase
VAVSVVLLAAGESTRMGRQKALLEWHGTTLLAYQLEQLAAVEQIGEIIVVTGHEPDAIREIVRDHRRARAVHNPTYQTGKVSSIKAGLGAVSAGADAVLLLAVDQPRPAAIIRTVVERYMERDASITVPVRAHRRGHPVVFAAALLPELLDIREETQGIRAVMERHANDVDEVTIDDDAIHLDLNRPSDVPGQPGTVDRGQA